MYKYHLWTLFLGNQRFFYSNWLLLAKATAYIFETLLEIGLLKGLGLRKEAFAL